MIAAQAETVSATMSTAQVSAVLIDSTVRSAEEVTRTATAPAGASADVTAMNDPLGGSASGEPAQAAKEAAAMALARRRREKKNRRKAKTAAYATVNPADVSRPADITNGAMRPAASPAPAATHVLEYQTDPPSIPVARYFPSGVFPAGELCAYRDDRTDRTSSAEVRERYRLDTDVVNALRHAAEAHRRVRGYMADHIRPGIKLLDICERLESATRALVGASGLDAGIAFPTGCSVNHVAAHFTPNAGDETVLGVNDVLKVDFGTHVGGRIIDSAWTVAFHPRYDPLVAAVRSATDAGIAAAGIDVRLGDIGAAIQEVMESHEVELGGVMRPIRCVRNLNGHSIGQYLIHGGVTGKSVPIVRAGGSTKMEEGECYAIETFGTTGRGYVVEGGECSHYMLRDDAPRRVPLRLPRARSLLATIEREFGTLAFCRRYLDRLGERRYALGLKALCDAGIVDPCPPLVETPGSYVAQFEHTILLGTTNKEVLSRGEDY